jgi:FeS assembly protein IscX
VGWKERLTGNSNEFNLVDTKRSGAPGASSAAAEAPGIAGTQSGQTRPTKEQNMPREILWTDAEEIGIQLQEKFPDIDPFTVRFTDLHKYVTELEGFADDPTKSNEPKLEAIQMAWHEEYEDAKG